MAQYSTLNTNTVNFDKMIKRFGVVTVMNAKVYEPLYEISPSTEKTALEVLSLYEAKAEPLCTLNTLKIANVSVEGPDKTVTGGQFGNPLIKFGKTARLEMQDALGNIEALAYLGGGIAEWEDSADQGMNSATAKKFVFHMGENFVGPKTIIGETFFVDQKSGEQIPVKILFYNVLPDSIFNLNQEAEGDAAVFDLNGDLLATPIRIYNNSTPLTTNVFYSILDSRHALRATATAAGEGPLNITFTTVEQTKKEKEDGAVETIITAYNLTKKAFVSDTVIKKMQETKGNGLKSIKITNLTSDSTLQSGDEVAIIYEFKASEVV